jgi:dienelactone hydrolase
MSGLAVQHLRVGEIPVVAVAPPSPTAVALWIPYFTGTAETMVPILEQLADAGLHAVSFDPWQHGGRGSETPDQLAERVFAAFRRGMWPILGQTTLDATRVLDQALASAGAAMPVVAGGTSMGGDVAVALAGIDPRVRRAAALVATPDWTRPGMSDDSRVPPAPIDQGEADAYAQWLYDQLDPITHLERYRRPLPILFACGAEDRHVPPDGALRFRDALPEGRVEVELAPGLGHGKAAFDRNLIELCVDFLADAG